MTHTWGIWAFNNISHNPRWAYYLFFHVPPINMKVATIKGGETTLIKDHLDQSFYLPNQEQFL